MLNGDEMKMAQRLIELAKKNKFAHAAHFLYFQVDVFLDDYNAGLYD